MNGIKQLSKGKILALLGDNSLKVNSAANTLVRLKIPRVCIIRGGIEAALVEAPDCLHTETQASSSIFSKFKF